MIKFLKMIKLTKFKINKILKFLLEFRQIKYKFGDIMVDKDK